jgi:pimeloyl-ACP methyl ester carboxylesterase
VPVIRRRHDVFRLTVGRSAAALLTESWAFGYPNARLLVIEKAGHIGQVEAPEIFFPAIDTFLQGSFPAAAKTIKHP